MNIVQNFLTKSDCYNSNRKIKVKGLMLHSVGCSQPNASVFLKNWNKSGLRKGVHAFIDANTGTVYQTLPWDHRAWHCGSGSNGSGNNTHIGVEMCEPSTIRYTGGASFIDLNPAATKKTVLRTYEAAVELFAYLCKEFDLDPMLDIVSHAEGNALGIATPHGDPEHLWETVGLSMDGFRTAVKGAMGKVTSNTTKTEKPVSGVSAASYRVKVTDPALNIRSGAGTKYPVVGVIKDKGVYTIVKEQGSWGKLKSGAGWIHLGYTKKI